jgi:hypothetical protein
MSCSAAQVGSHGGVAICLFGVVADREPHRPCALVAVAVAAGRDVYLFDPQVAGHGAVPAGAGQRGGGLGVGVAQLLGVDVVPTAARFSRWATEAKISPAISSSASSRKSIAR